jgi:hypothetical protein
MNKVLRVELTEEERQDLDKYLIGYPFGQISHILRNAVRDFIKVEKEKAELVRKEAQGGYQGSKRNRSKKT